MKIQPQLIVWHRVFGLVSCLFFSMWFLSAFVMMYARMPELTARERMERLPPLDTSRVRITPAQAAERAGVRQPGGLVLSSLFGRPVYRILNRGSIAATVFADDGRSELDFAWPEAAASIRPYLPSSSTGWRLLQVLNEPDQWTLSGEIQALDPLYKVAIDDGHGTVLYISGTTGDVVLKTTARTRALAWAGAIPHWIYLRAIRKHAEGWRQLVIWIAAAGCVTSILGIVLGLVRFSPSKRYRVAGVSASASPYQGAKRWHHWAGLIFGVFTFTWVLSGMLSLDPFPVSPTDPADKQIAYFRGGNLVASAFQFKPTQISQTLVSSLIVKEITFSQVDGKPFYEAAETTGNSVFLNDRGELAQPFPASFLVDAARRAVPNGRIVDSSQLPGYDSYYYDRDRLSPLPVLRVRFDDPAATWLYIDPVRGVLMARFDRSARFDRWVYHGLHSLDFPFLWPYRPWWDLVVIVLCTGGLVVSVSGVVIGYQRLRSYVTSKGQGSRVHFLH